MIQDHDHWHSTAAHKHPTTKFHHCWQVRDTHYAVTHNTLHTPLPDTFDETRTNRCDDDLYWWSRCVFLVPRVYWSGPQRAFGQGIEKVADEPTLTKVYTLSDWDLWHSRCPDHTWKHTRGKQTHAAGWHAHLSWKDRRGPRGSIPQAPFPISNNIHSLFCCYYSLWSALRDLRRSTFVSQP